MSATNKKADLPLAALIENAAISRESATLCDAHPFLLICEGIVVLLTIIDPKEIVGKHMSRQSAA
jgi:hypothetical protein